MSTSIITPKLPEIRRPVRAVELPGGSAVHVRDVTLAELRRIDARADGVPDGDERAVRSALLLCAFSLADAGGNPLMPLASDADLRELEETLTTSQIRAVCRAAVPDKADAKN